MVSDEIRKKIESLSPREREVFELVCEELTYKEISKKLHMSESAVKTHMLTVRSKFGIDQLSRRKTAIELNNTYCSALKEIRDQSDKKKATEKESKVEPKPKPQEKEKAPVKEPEIEKDKEEDKEKEKPKEDVFKKVVKKDDEKAPFEKPEESIDEKKDGYQMKKTDQPEKDRFRTLKTIWRVIAIAAIIFSGYVIYERFFGPTQIQPTPSVEESGTEQEEIVIDDPEVLPVDENQPAPDTPEAVIVPDESPTTEPTPPPQPAILFEDNFETGLSEAWEVVSGNPFVVNGMLASDQDTWLFVGDPSWINYSIEYDTQAERISKIYQGFNATAVRVVDFDNMYAGKWTNLETQWFIIENGDWNEIPNSKTEVDWSENINHRITANGNIITVYINGIKHFSFVDSKYTQGRVGIMVHDNTQIDNFKIKEILDN